VYFLILSLQIYKQGPDLESYDKASRRSTSSSQLKSITRLQQFVRLCLGRIGLIPIYYASVVSLSTMQSSGAAAYLHIAVLVFSLPVVLLEHFFFVKVDCSENSISSPTLSLRKAMYLMSLGIICGSYDYNTQAFMKILMLLTASIFSLGFFNLLHPYCNAKFSIISITQSVMVLYASVVLAIAQLLGLNDQSQSFATIVYFLALGPILLLANVLTLRLSRPNSAKPWHQRGSTDLWILVKAAMQEGQENSGEDSYSADIQKFSSVGLSLIKDNAYASVWLVNYYLSRDDLLSVKVCLGKLKEFDTDLLSLVSIGYCRAQTLQWIVKSKGEREAYDLVAYKEDLVKVVDKDRIASDAYWRFFEELGRESPNFRNLERLNSRLQVKMKECRASYQQAIATYSRDPLIPEYYGEYLNLIENSSNAQLMIAKATFVKKEKEQRMKRAESTEVFAQTSTLLLVRLAQKEAGSIVWVSHPEATGYHSLELIDTSFLDLVCSSVKTSDDLLSQVEGLKFGVATRGALLDKTKHIINCTVTCALVHDTDWSLALLLSIKPTKGQEYAVLGPDGRLTNMTKGFEQCLLHELNVDEQDLDNPDFLKAVLWEPDQTLLEQESRYSKLTVRTASLETIFPTASAGILIDFEDGVKVPPDNQLKHIAFPSQQLPNTINVEARHADQSESASVPIPDINPTNHPGEIIRTKSANLEGSSSSQSLEVQVHETVKVFKAKLIRLIKLLKLSLMIAVSPIQNVLFTASCITVNTMVSNLNGKLDTELGLSHQLGKLTLSIISLTLRGKELYLISQGFNLGSEEEFVRERLKVQF
jgi:hypothetical protein